MPAVITRRPAPPSPAPPSPVPSSRPAVAIALCLVALLCFASPSARAVATKLTPQILIGVPQPVVGAPITVDVLVEGAADTAPLATGNITIHWGDETPTSVAALSNSLITAQHTYAKSAAYTITASYPGDSNYLSASTTQAIIVVPTTPSAVTLNTFGDSITYGRGATEPQYAWADITAATEGWALNDTGIRGDFSIDTCAIINSNEPLPASAHNTLFDGENDLPHVFASAAGQAEYISAMTSCAVWLATTQGANRTTAASSANSLTGTWTPSTLYTSTGLNSTAAGSTISGSFTGNVFYAQLTSTAATNDSVSISIDSAAATTYSPPLLAYHGQRATYGPYFIRIPLTGSNSSTHSVKFTCVTPGAAGCYVDWFAGNGLISPASPPYLWLATPYITDQTNYPLNEFLQLATFMRNIQLELSADGLPVYLTDVANWFQAPTNPTCMFDTIHPNDCGHAILAATFINSMNVLLPASFKSDATAALSATPDSAILGQSVTLTATVTGSAATPTGIATFSYDGIALAAVPLQSGAATFKASTAGLAPALYPVTVSYSGDSNYYSVTTAPFNITLAPSPTTTTVSAAPASVTPPANVTLTATVTGTSGLAKPTGSVTFFYETLSLGSSTLTDGVATLNASSTGIAPGSYAITAKYSGSSADTASTSAPVSVTVK
jgi:hypothetical protein